MRQVKNVAVYTVLNQRKEQMTASRNDVAVIHLSTKFELAHVTPVFASYVSHRSLHIHTSQLQLCVSESRLKIDL